MHVRYDEPAVPGNAHHQDHHPEEHAESLGDATTISTFERIRSGEDYGSVTGRDLAMSGIFAELLSRSGLWKEGRVINRGAGSLTNLAQDEQHVLLAGQCSQQRAFGERLDLLRGYVEAYDQVTIVLDLIEDRLLLRWPKIELVFCFALHGGRL